MKIRLDHEKMKVELEANFFPLMQSRYEFPGLYLDIQGQLMGAKRSKSFSGLLRFAPTNCP